MQYMAEWEGVASEYQRDLEHNCCLPSGRSLFIYDLVSRLVSSLSTWFALALARTAPRPFPRRLPQPAMLTMGALDKKQQRASSTSVSTHIRTRTRSRTSSPAHTNE